MQVFSQNETWLSEVTGFFPLVYIIFPINKYWVLDNLSVKCTLDNSWITSLDTDIDCLSFIDDWSQKRLLLDWWFEPRIVTTAVYGRTDPCHPVFVFTLYSGPCTRPAGTCQPLMGSGRSVRVSRLFLCPLYTRSVWGPMNQFWRVSENDGP